MSCWNNVTLYGPTTVIERFRRECIDPTPLRTPQSVRGHFDGREVAIGFDDMILADDERSVRLGTVVRASNYREERLKQFSWTFSFDTHDRFPEELSEKLALVYPILHFNCACIHAFDDFMGFGWFNIPAGGEGFRQDMEVPVDYWTVRSCRREPEA